MPTLFSRKYMRGKPRRTEKLVGAFVLGLTGFIIAAFLLTGGLFADLVDRSPVLKAAKGFFGIDDRPLFVVAPENMKPPLPPHELRVAEAMLPKLPDTWKRGEVTVVRPEPEDAHGFDPVVMYETRYAGEGEREVRIHDMGSPDAAFGIWRARMPAEAERVTLGRGGWWNAGTGEVAFWAGRYFTQVRPTPPVEKAEITAFARMMAAVQLNYGGPFWAESVLPVEGRVEHSLRYFRKAGLGIEELADLWTAEYDGGVTLGVMRPRSTEGVLAGLRSRLESAGVSGDETSDDEGHEERSSESESTYGSVASHESGSVDEDESDAGAVDDDRSASHGGLPPDLMDALGEEIVTGRHNGRMLLAYTAGPYVFVVSGADAEPMLALAKATRDRWSGGPAGSAQAVADAGPAPGHASGQARFAEVEGGEIHPPAKIERFTDNLYEKIDGREGQFRAYGFVELRFGQYQDTRHQHAYDVYIYDMGGPNNALGIYMAEKAESAESLKLGRDGYVSGANVYFYKGKYYVNVLGPADGGEGAARNAQRIAAAIAETIADTGGTLWAESLLPREGRVGSLRYQATSALAHDFLNRFFFANYKVDGVDLEMFIHKAPGADEARALLQKYAEETAKYETVLSREATDRGEAVVSESLGSFTVAFHKGPYFAGVTNCKDRALAERQAAGLREKLNANDKGEPAPEAPAASQDESSSEGGGEYDY